ncbi:hypothetical protein [Peribacillus sp. SCS-155]|uniref:hypothetical protein n=1 Tax=Peribacillus sedimenti TaxID=3115297 RepID=UPI0039058423
MKKYWKSCLISIFIVLVIGSFYIQSAYSASKLPDFFIKTVEGKGEEFKGITLDGYLNALGSEQPLEINRNSTKYQSERSYFEEIKDSETDSITIRNLQRQYPEFMRSSKQVFEDAFFEDDKMLVSAFVDFKYNKVLDSSFVIKVLDKRDEKVRSMNLPIPNVKNYAYVWVQEVQYIDGQLMVVSNNNPHDGENHEIHVYSFDIGKKKLLDDRTILSENDPTFDYIYMRQTDNSKENNYIVLRKQTVDPEKPAYINQPLFIYNLHEQVEVKFNIANSDIKNVNETGEGNYYDKNNLYILGIKNGTATVSIYHLAGLEPHKSIRIPLGGKEAFFTAHNIWKRQIYFASSEGEDSDKKLIIADLQNGNILYKGVVQSKKHINNLSATLQIHGITIDK